METVAASKKLSLWSSTGRKNPLTRDAKLCVCLSNARPPLYMNNSAVLASFFLHERLGTVGKVGCALCLIGSVVIVLHSPEEKEISSVDEILNYALQPGNRFFLVDRIKGTRRTMVRTISAVMQKRTIAPWNTQ